MLLNIFILSNLRKKEYYCILNCLTTFSALKNNKKK